MDVFVPTEGEDKFSLIWQDVSISLAGRNPCIINYCKITTGLIYI